MTFRGSRYDVIKLYDKEKLEEFYNCYMKNIKLNLFETTYLHPNEMIIKENHDREWNKISKKDGYLHDWQKNRTGLAKDILENGNYFPIWCYINDGKYIVSEGVHRVDSMQLAYEQGIWKDEKAFIIIFDKEFDISIKKFNISAIGHQVEIYYPVHNIENRWFENHFGKKLVRFDNWERFKKMSEDGNLQITIDTYDEFINACKVYHKFLRHSFYRYKTETNDRIDPRFELR